MTTSDLFRVISLVKSRIFQPPHLHPISFPPGRSTADSSGAPPSTTCERAHGDAVAVVLWSTPFWVEKLKVEGKLYIILTYFIEYDYSDGQSLRTYFGKKN